MKAYIAVSNNKRKELEKEINAIISALNTRNIEPFLFVDRFHFSSTQEREMMTQAVKSIDECGMMIAETSEKAIGVGVEAGYSKASGKLLIYVRKKTAEHSTTVAGISDYQVYYSDCNDLKQQLENIFLRVFK